MKDVLIIGCGDIGRRVATRIGAEQVIGIVRSGSSARALAALGVEARTLDLDAPVEPSALPAAGRKIFYFAPPQGTGNTDDRVRRVCAALEYNNRPSRVVYISTSAVYGDCAGAWIDETAALNPGTARGHRRLDAERQWLKFGETCGIPVIILRVPGIYAHDKLPLRRLREGLPVLVEDEAPFTNRIHADDLARVCIAAMQRGKAGRAYNVSDGRPTSMTDYFNKVADRLGLARPPQVGRDEAEKHLSSAMLSFLGESKRLANTRMLEELQIELQYPDLDRGLAAVAREEPAK